MDASNANGPVNLVRCHGMGGNQEWTYDEKVKKKKKIILASVGYDFQSIVGSGYKTCQHWKLLNTCYKRRSSSSTTATLQLLQWTKVAHAI